MNTKIFVSLTDTAKEWLVREAYDPADSARQLRDTARAWVPGLQLGKRWASRAHLPGPFERLYWKPLR